MPETTRTTLRMAVAQSTVRVDPTDADGLRASGAEVRRLMTQAAEAGARLVHFAEGALCFPSKYVMSELGPDQVGPSDWSRADWPVLAAELDRIAALSGELGIWTVIPSVHRLPAPARPHNSQYVVSDHGTLVARYDERTLSTTKITHMYSPGTRPVTFEVDGHRFGLALGMDAHFPELFTQYEQLDVDGVLLSYETGGDSDRVSLATKVRGHAVANNYWISLAVSASPTGAHAGLIDLYGAWAAECPTDGSPALAVADLHHDNDLAPQARTWRRQTRNRITT